MPDVHVFSLMVDDFITEYPQVRAAASAGILSIIMPKISRTVQQRPGTGWDAYRYCAAVREITSD